MTFRDAVEIAEDEAKQEFDHLLDQVRNNWHLQITEFFSMAQDRLRSIGDRCHRIRDLYQLEEDAKKSPVPRRPQAAKERQ